ncbi:hypothetical protein MVEN_00307900 [Mycena venus]|uniref:Uncharacterized protein n=1 Tax=Mycena venus TaxID=2733690 RepID=A0A8H7DCW3_9AGAR|nr:hypothetical protein MVEN_00307900 [Mycena venus]
MSLSVLDFHNMGNTISTPIILWALAPIPGNTLRFIVLGLVTASLFIYAVNRQRPLHKLGRVEDAIEVAEEILQYAKANCPRDHVQLMDNEGRLLEAKLSASKVQTRLLKTRDDTTWKEYLQNLWEILQSINECAKEVKETETSMLLTVQAEHERQLSADIKDSREIRESITSSTRESFTHLNSSPLWVRFQRQYSRRIIHRVSSSELGVQASDYVNFVIRSALHLLSLFHGQSARL